MVMAVGMDVLAALHLFTIGIGVGARLVESTMPLAHAAAHNLVQQGSVLSIQLLGQGSQLVVPILQLGVSVERRLALHDGVQPISHSSSIFNGLFCTTVGNII